MKLFALPVGSLMQPLARFRSTLPKGLRRTLVPFIISRLIMVLIFTAVPLVARVPIEQWARDDNITIKLNAEAVSNGLSGVALANDAGWYISIAKTGYEHRPFDTTKQANWAFFPLHPILWMAAAATTGEWVWSGMLLSNLLALAGLSLLWHLTSKLTSSDKAADGAVLFACFWPTSYFMSLPQTEALFFAMTTLAYLAARSQRWWLAGFAGMLSSATRFNGLFLLPALFLAWWRGERRVADLIKLAPIVLGTLAFMAYLWATTGNPTAFKDIQITWGREPTAPWVALLDYLHRPLKVAVPWNPKMLHFVMVAIGFCSAVTCWRKGWRDLAVFTLLTLLAPLSTGTLISITRYLGVAPGVYVALAVWTEQRPRLGQLLIAFFALSMGLLCTLFAAGINIGGA